MGEPSYLPEGHPNDWLGVMSDIGLTLKGIRSSYGSLFRLGRGRIAERLISGNAIGFSSGL